MNQYLQSALDAIDDTAGTLPVDVIVRTVQGRWSVAQILEHLSLAFGANAAALEKALASGELRARKPGLRQALGRMLVVEIGYFPRVQAPAATRPTGIAPERSLPSVRGALRRLDDTLTRVAERFGEDVRVANHPYFGGLTVRQWRKFHWRHTSHHMAQIRGRRGDGVRP
jgi:hypothetical protein